MALTDALKRAPRWAWITAGGVGIGAAGIKLWNNRAKPDSEDEATAGMATDANGYPKFGGMAPVPPIVTPVVIANPGESNTAFGLQGLHELYIGAVQGVQEQWGQIWGPVQTAQLSLLTSNAEALQALALAGSAPNSQPAAPPPPQLVPFPVPSAPAPPVPLPLPVAAAPAPAPAGPAPCPPGYPHRSARGCYKNVGHNFCHCEGTGAKRKCITRRDHGHLYSDGQRIHMNFSFVKPGC